ncbi:hypothetical protein V0M98_32930 (plasmid) [Pseudomonas silesiensis]|uniref:hypothetical protein n=1 Tax=Pseudomonas silesiensis TaxID=1853130 RepID=UPI0030D1CBD1
MALIRCLGKIQLPLAYRRYMRAELKMYRDKRIHSDNPFNEWDQDILEPECGIKEGSALYRQNFVKRHWLQEDGPVIELPKPAKCPLLEARMGQFFQGRQTHVAMTLVSTIDHRDLFDDQLDTTLLIPYEVSPLHLLWVEDEERVLLPNHIYAFSQKREHALLYGTENIAESLGSRPASLLSVSFSKKAGRVRNK